MKIQSLQIVTPNQGCPNNCFFCVSKKVDGTIRYLILREDCKLYTKWDDKGSILF